MCDQVGSERSLDSRGPRGGGGLGDPEAHSAHTDRRASCPRPKASTAPRLSSKAVPRNGDTKGAGRAGRGVATSVSAADAAGPSCGAGGTAEALAGGCAWAGAGPGRGTGAGGGAPPRRLHSGVAHSGRHGHLPLAKTGPLSIYMKALWEIGRHLRPEKPSCPQRTHRVHV